MTKTQNMETELININSFVNTLIKPLSADQIREIDIQYQKILVNSIKKYNKDPLYGSVYIVSDCCSGSSELVSGLMND